MPTNPNAETIIDYITGEIRPNIGAEANRQKAERYLVDILGYDKSAIEVDTPLTFEIGEEVYVSHLDLVVSAGNVRFMVIKCAAGSLASREREVVAAARLLEDYPLPIAVATDGDTALVWDATNGKQIGQGMAAIPSLSLAEDLLHHTEKLALSPSRLLRQKLIFRAYDTMNVNVASSKTAIDNPK